MSLKDYKIAQSMGMEQYKKDLLKGIYPYVQVLEELTQNVEIVSEIPLGVVDIPLEQVAGTNGHGRSTSFASNFMPLLREETEFATKWSNLCRAHLEEGLRDPIKCYEFMNRFYVVEGNKRVSVLKYFGAVEFKADVTRLVPRSDDSEESKAYFEFLKFYKTTGINFINFTKALAYSELLEYLGKAAGETWDKEFTLSFKGVYYRFKNAYVKMLKGSDADAIAAADAFLECIKVYPFEEMMGMGARELDDMLKKMMPTFPLLRVEQPVVLQMQPEEEHKKGIVERLTDTVFGSAPKQLKVALVYDKTPETSAWTYGHDLGRRILENTMGDAVSVTTVENVMKQGVSVDKILGELALDHDVIFTTTPVLIYATRKAAVENPKVKFLNCSVNTAVSHIRTYYGRMYEAKFLCGLVAGAMTRKDTIAYVADYPISGMTANINAFSRGVQIVNPRAKVHLVWSSLQDSDLDRDLWNIGADVISFQDFLATGKSDEQRFGLIQYRDGEITRLCRPFWDWGLFYARIIRGIMDGTWSVEKGDEEHHAINYWWGLSCGAVDLLLDEAVPEGVQQLVSFYKKAIKRRNYSPFDGIILDQGGTNRSLEDKYIPTGNIVTMDWLMDNIVGSIPDYSEFKPDAQNLLRIMKLTGEDSEGVMAVGPERVMDETEEFR
ncbi:MAG: BMP family ABC transporter substrate-binding protein [Lachnospiraceae bacterium]|nr:BMP family ABC transporter substrate-binding protein [Lachnospiraceae bacterium]